MFPLCYVTPGDFVDLDVFDNCGGWSPNLFEQRCLNPSSESRSQFYTRAPTYINESYGYVSRRCTHPLSLQLLMSIVSKRTSFPNVCGTSPTVVIHGEGLVVSEVRVGQERKGFTRKHDIGKNGFHELRESMVGRKKTATSNAKAERSAKTPSPLYESVHNKRESHQV